MITENEEILERQLVRMEGWIDRCPWLSRYYLNVLQQRLGLTSPATLIAVVVLHVLVVLLLLCAVLYVLIS